MKPSISPALLTLCTSATLATAALAADAPEPITFATQKVVVFKDGYALIIKKGTGTTDAKGEIHTLDVPDAAVLGSFWATTPNAGALVGMRAGWREDTVEESAEETALDNLSILRANLGSPCAVVLTGGEKFNGVIREVLVRESETIVSTPTVANPLLSRYPQPAQVDSAAASTTTTGFVGTHFVLRTEDGDQLLPAAAVQSLAIPDMKTKTTRKLTTKTRTKRLSFRFKNPGEEHEITMMYFRPGVRWIPTYRIDLPEGGDGKLAQISLQAEILNEAEDLVEAPFDIVVGVPNFRFKGAPSPLALESVMRNTLAQAEPTLMGQLSNSFSNAQYGSRHSEVYTRAPQAQGGDEEAELLAAADGAGAHDLFIYSLPDLRLRKGDRAAVSIFTAALPFRDVYTWDLHLKRVDVATTPSGQGVTSPLELAKNQVWHQIELTNTTGVPWTTGAALIMQGQQPIAQELLTYTSPKDLCRIPVTVSVATRGTFSEKEAGRELGALKWEGDTYMLIRNEAALELRNHKDKPIDAEITVKLGGRVAEASDDGQVTLLPFDAADWNQYRGSRAVNNSSAVRWEVKVGAGKAFQPKIGYGFYTR